MYDMKNNKFKKQKFYIVEPYIPFWFFKYFGEKGKV